MDHLRHADSPDGAESAGPNPGVRRSWRRWFTLRHDWIAKSALVPAELCYQILAIYAWAFAAVGTVASIFVIFQYPGKVLTEPLFDLFVVLVGVQWLAVFLRGLPFVVRHGIWAGSAMGIVILAEIAAGLPPNIVFLLLMVVSSYGIFFGLRAGVVAALGLYGVLTLVAFGWVAGVFPLVFTPAEAADFTDLTAPRTWARILISTTLLTVAAMLVAGRLLRQQQEFLRAANRAIQQLKVEQSERVQAMAALRSSQDTLAKVFRFSPEAIAVTDLETGQYTEVNDGFCRIFGLSREEVLGRSASEIGHWVDPEERGRLLAELQAHGSVHGFRALGRRKNGEIRTFRISAETVELTGRQAVVVSGHDITDSLRADQALRDSEAKFSAAFQASPVSIVMTDFETGSILDVNDAFLRIYGGSRDLVCGRTGVELGLWPDAAERAAVVDALRAGRPARNLRIRGRTFAGTPITSLVNCEVFKLRDRQCMLSTALDITDFERAEAQLRNSEERFRSLIEQSSDIITVLNRDGIVRYLSPSVERLLGFTPAELTGLSVFTNVHTEDQPRGQELLRHVLAQPQRPVNGEFRVRRRDGAWRRLQIVARSVPGQADEGFIILNARDVTDSALLEEQLRQVQKMEAIGQLSAGVAHDFNNLLTVVQGNVALIQTDETLRQPVREHLNEIEQAAARAANLTRQLLAFSRRQALQLRVVDLNRVVSDLTKMLQRIVGEHVQIRLSLTPGPALVQGDVGMLEQVLLNFVVNARDAMPQGGTLTIATELGDAGMPAGPAAYATGAGPLVSLKVTDTGCGIPPEALPKIFEPFYTTKDIGKGTGLGLATVYGIVTQHRGTVDVTSTVEQGTTFRVFLPRVLDAAPDERLRERRPDLAQAPGNELILLVEDESAVRMMIRNVLERCGYRLLEADNPINAVELWNLHRDEIRLLLTDMLMPGGIGGRELAQTMRRQRPDLPVIFMSGYSTEVAGRHFPLEQHDSFLGKPFDVATLSEKVRAALAG